MFTLLTFYYFSGQTDPGYYQGFQSATEIKIKMLKSPSYILSLSQSQTL